MSATVFSRDLHVETRSRSIVSITRDIEKLVATGGISDGLATVFVHHTSASLLINENADPDVRVDLENWLSRLVKDGDPIFTHTAEGDDDMSAHIRSVLTATTLTIPVREGRLDLGTWQGLFLWEHRTSSHQRRVSLTVVGV